MSAQGRRSRLDAKRITAIVAALAVLIIVSYAISFPVAALLYQLILPKVDHEFAAISLPLETQLVEQEKQVSASGIVVEASYKTSLTPDQVRQLYRRQLARSGWVNEAYRSEFYTTWCKRNYTASLSFPEMESLRLQNDFSFDVSLGKISPCENSGDGLRGLVGNGVGIVLGVLLPGLAMGWAAFQNSQHELGRVIWVGRAWAIIVVLLGLFGLIGSISDLVSYMLY